MRRIQDKLYELDNTIRTSARIQELEAKIKLLEEKDKRE